MLESLLGQLSPRQFVDEYLHRLPLAMPGTAHEIARLGSWKTLGAILDSDAPDLLVVSQGQRSNVPDPRTVEQAQQLVAAGHTLVVRHAERHHDQLRKTAHSLESQLAGPVNVHLYITPPGTHGFSWHYDAEDVFIVQSAGAKTYSLRKNTVNPWPLEEAMPADLRYERELMPMMQVELRPDDWLYIPCGYWHRADALAGDAPSISLAIGIMSPTAIELLDRLRGRLLSSLLWRQRLPVTGSAASLSPEELRDRYRDILKDLADDLARQLTSENFLHAVTSSPAARQPDRGNS